MVMIMWLPFFAAFDCAALVPPWAEAAPQSALQGAACMALLTAAPSSSDGTVD
jgi:hypothetical protein